MYLASCSPRPRGWSRPGRPAARRAHLLPAPAGMVPGTTSRTPPARSAPRARGDGPPSAVDFAEPDTCSPRPRGWSPRHHQAPALLGLLPAPAGMVPPRTGRTRTTAAAPRARGDGPSNLPGIGSLSVCSPRPRGWSPVGQFAHRPGRLLPAPAGMVPPPRRRHSPQEAAPRARGDGPPAQLARATVIHCSPRPRGWSRPDGALRDVLDLLPAPAGMVPRRSASPS